MQRLFDILTYRRQHLSKSEADFIKKYIDVLPDINVDAFGNRYVTVGDAKPTTLFSCHTDTVHSEEGRQKIEIDSVMKIISLQLPPPVKKEPVVRKWNDWRGKKGASSITSTPPYKYKRRCLGADDGAGIWLMLNMIDAKIPGLYIFHRGEECGGQGSSFIAKDNKALLEGIKRAVAFDRKGQTNIIDRQAGGKCCSPKFVEALSKQLNMEKKHTAATGSFTDTANYTDIIPECTNVSCGYESEHSSMEILDYGYLADLLVALIGVKWDELPTFREPGDSGTYANDFGFNRKAAITMNKKALRKVMKENPEILVSALWNAFCTDGEIERARTDVQKADRQRTIRQAAKKVANLNS